MFSKHWTYPDIQIWRYVHRISLYRYTAMFARQATSRLFFGRHFLQPDKIPASQIPFSGHRSKMRLAPKCRHVIMPLCQNKRGQWQRSAKINASQLQYLIPLLRTVTSYKSGRRYPRVSSLNKPNIIGNRSCSGPWRWRLWLYYKHSTAHSTGRPWA